MPFTLKWSMPDISSASDTNRNACLQVLQCLNDSENSLQAYVKIINLFINSNPTDATFPFLTEYARRLVYSPTPKKEPALSRNFTFDDAGRRLAKCEDVGKKCVALESYLKLAGSKTGSARILEIFMKKPGPNLTIGGEYVQEWAALQKEIANGVDAQQENDLDSLNDKLSEYLKALKSQFRGASLVQKVTSISSKITDRECVDLLEFFTDPDVEQKYKSKFAEFIIDNMGSRIIKFSVNNKTRIGDIYRKYSKIKPPFVDSEDFDTMRQALAQLKADLTPKVTSNSVKSSVFSLSVCASETIVYHKSIVSKSKTDMISYFKTLLYLNSDISELTTSFNLNSKLESTVEKLMTTVASFLKLANANLVHNVNNGININLTPHILYNLDDYNTMMGNRKIDEEDQSLSTPYNTLDIPLYRISSYNGFVQLQFFNLKNENKFYLDDPGQGSIPDVSFYDAGGDANNINRWILRPARNDFNVNYVPPSMDDDRKMYITKYRINYWFDGWVCRYTRTYIPLYVLAGNSLQSHVIWRLSSGFNTGLSRADTVEPENYCWAFAGNLQAIKDQLTQRFGAGFNNLTVAQIGAFLGLQADRALFNSPVERSWCGLNEISGATANLDFSSLGRNTILLSPTKWDFNWPSNSDEFAGRSIVVNKEHFVQCATPFDTESQQGDDLKKKTLSSEASLNNFCFYYFRRCLEIDPNNLKVRKESISANNRPKYDDVEPNQIINLDEETVLAYGVNLPVLMEGNYEKFDRYKKTLAPIKNKDTPLLSSKAPRLQAGKVMSQINALAAEAFDLRQGSLSAGTVAAALMSRALGTLDQATETDGDAKMKNRPAEPESKDYDGDAQMNNNTSANSDEVPPDFAQAWRRLKNTNLDFLPTDQEWCHLMGHGDNGGERIGNFVGGSKHCNTEQLAIELAQRGVTQQTKNTGIYSLRSTAYLMPDESMKFSDGGTTYLELDRDYVRVAYLNKLEASAQNRSAMVDDKGSRAQNDRAVLQTFGDGKYLKELDKAGANAPVAAFVRYKVNKKVLSGNNSTGPRTIKALDHVFEGQSEFIDRNQFSILFRTVQYMIDPETFFEELRETLLKPSEVKEN